MSIDLDSVLYRKKIIRTLSDCFCLCIVSACDLHCTSGCNTEGEDKCDSSCESGYSLNETDHTCIGMLFC